MKFMNYRLQEEAGGEGGAGGGGGDPWYSSIAGDDEGRIETLKAFETPDAFFTKFNELSESGGNGDITMEQYRQIASGGDEDLLKTLERYADPVAMTKGLVDAKARIREGFKPEAYPEDGSDEQKAAWREQNDIPSEHTAYLENIGEGLAIGEDDQPYFESLAEELHAANVPQSAFNAVTKWYNTWAEERQTAIADQDSADQAEVDDFLGDKYGSAEYRANKNNVMDTFKAYFPEDQLKELLNGRLGDNKAFFNNTAILQGFIEMARVINPVSTLVGGGNDPGQSIDNRLDEIAAMRKKDYDSYMKNDKVLAEERELLDAKSKMNQRAAA